MLDPDAKIYAARSPYLYSANAPTIQNKDTDEAEDGCIILGIAVALVGTAF